MAGGNRESSTKEELTKVEEEDGSEDSRLELRLSSNLLQRVKKVAKDRRVKLSVLVRDLLWDCVEEHEHGAEEVDDQI